MVNYHLLIFKLLAGLIVIALILSYIAEWYFGLYPCVLCIYQRFLYIAALALCGLGVVFTRFEKAMSVLTLLVLVSISVISFYQVMLEYKIIDPLIACSVIDYSSFSDIGSLQSALNQMEVNSCANPQHIFLAFSMAGMSFVFSTPLALFLGIFTAISIFFTYDQKKYTREL